jgi:superfamily II DNA or RNA helicase
VISVPSPTVARLLGYEGKKQSLAKFLTYKDKAAEFEYLRLSKSLKRYENARSYILQEISEEAYETRLLELKVETEKVKQERQKCLLFEDGKGFWTYSGLAPKIAAEFDDVVEYGYTLPDASVMAWENVPVNKDRPYQEEALKRLLGASGKGPVCVELATGAGKSTVIRNIIKELALPALVMAPSVSIAGQLYDDLVLAFGKRYVGLYGNGKKDFKKKIVIGIDDSLTRIEPGDEAWKWISEKVVFIADESHLCPAKTLRRICFGLAASAPYRFFFSATQMRNDGLDLVLDGITGPVVMRKNVRELVDEGYLSRPVFKMVKVQSNSSYDSPDATRMTRKHLYYNKVVVKIAADLANKFVSLMKRPVVILVEEIEQYEALQKHLQHVSKFAHGLARGEAKKRVPCVLGAPCTYKKHVGQEGIVLMTLDRECENHGKLKPSDLVDAFNQGKIPILVGTSCISTGTDIRVAEAGIYLMGKISEIKIKQAVGRMTRGGELGTVVNPWTGKKKLDAIWVDFDVVDIDVMHRHAGIRSSTYSEIYGDPKVIDMTGVM